MSTNFPPKPGPHPSTPAPYGYGQQPGYSGPPSNAAGSGGAVVMIVIAVGVVILLGLACAGAVAGFLLFARASQDVEVNRIQEEVDAMRREAVAMRSEAATLDESVPPAGFTPIDPRRARWSYPVSPEGASGSIAQQDGGEWLETRSDNLTVQFQEVERTDEYVEIFDPSRRLNVRLYADRMEWKKNGQDWFRGQAGSWDAAAQPAAASDEPPLPTNGEPPQP
jgi:hypothetical protein